MQKMIFYNWLYNWRKWKWPHGV